MMMAAVVARDLAGGFKIPRSQPKRDSCLVASNADQDSGSRLRTHSILRIHVRPARSILSNALNLRCSANRVSALEMEPGDAWAFSA